MRAYVFYIVLRLFLVYGLKSGPYHSKLTRVGPCSNPTKPIDDDPPSYFYAEIYNTSAGVTMMKGNITVARVHKMKQMKAKSYVLDNNKWTVNYMMNNLGCNRIFFPVFAMATGVNYDIKNCVFYKGTFLYDNFELNKIQHTWMKSQEYGQIRWRLEVFSEVGNVYCYEFDTLVEPLK